ELAAGAARPEGEGVLVHLVHRPLGVVQDERALPSNGHRQSQTEYDCTEWSLPEHDLSSHARKAFRRGERSSALFHCIPLWGGRQALHTRCCNCIGRVLRGRDRARVDRTQGRGQGRQERYGRPAVLTVRSARHGHLVSQTLLSQPLHDVLPGFERAGTTLLLLPKCTAVWPGKAEWQGLPVHPCPPPPE